MTTNKLNIRITLTEAVLGSAPSSAEVYKDYIASKAPDASTIEDEVASVGVDETAENKMTVFPKEDGKPFVWDYQIKGFFKSAASMMKTVPGSESAKVKAFKKVIDGMVFPAPRKIFFEDFSEMGKCERPLRASTPMGERVALACSEELPAGATLTFSVEFFGSATEDLIREWLDYGKYNGLGQWRNSGKGRFLWEALDENGERVGGNL